MKRPKMGFKNVGWRKSSTVILIVLAIVVGAIWYLDEQPDPVGSQYRLSVAPKEMTVFDFRNDDRVEEDVSKAMGQSSLKVAVLRGEGVKREHIETLLQHPSLQMIVLSDTQLNGIDFGLDDNSKTEVHFCDQEPIKRLEQLQVRLVKPYGKTRLMSGRYPDLGRKLLGHPGLREIARADMRNCVVEREAYESCKRLEGLTHLFVGYGFDDSMVDSLLPLKNLEQLDLSQSMVTDQAMEQIAELPKLKILTLGPNMGDESLRLLTRCKTLEVVHCGYSQIGDDGIAALADSESIRGLDIGGRPITGQSLESLSRYPKLRDLAFSNGENIEYDDYRQLGNIPSLKRLKAPLPQAIRNSLERAKPGLQATEHLVIGGKA